MGARNAMQTKRLRSMTVAAAMLASVAAVPTVGAAATSPDARQSGGRPASASPPSAARMVRLSRAGVGRLRVTWLPPASDGGAPVQDYLVHVYRSNRSFVGRVEASADQTAEILTGLREGASYRVYVNAQNSVGYSEASRPSNLESVAVPVTPGRPYAPIGPMVRPVGRAGLRVSWGAAAGNGASVTSYLVTVAGPDGRVVRRRTVPAGARSVTVRGLPPKVPYTVRVTAVNRYGAGVPSDPTRAEALAVVRGSGVGLYSFRGIVTQDDWANVMREGWAGLLDTEALGTKTPPYTGLVGNPDAAVQAALDASPSYRGFWVSFWTVDSPDPTVDGRLSDFYSYGRQAGTYAAQHTRNLPGHRLPDYLAIDYEGYFQPANQAQYIAETKGWADGIHRVLPGMRILFYTAGQNVFLNNDLGVIKSAVYQPAIAPIIGNSPLVPADGNVVGYQGLFATCTHGSARPSVRTVLRWGPDHPISQVEFADAKDDCGPGIATPSATRASRAPDALSGAASGEPTCTSAMSVGYEGTQAADGANGVAVFTVRNGGSHACVLGGSPKVMLRTASGVAMTTPVHAGPALAATERSAQPVTLAPGAQSYFTVSFLRRPDAGPASVAAAATVTLPGVSAVQTLSIPTDTAITLSPVGSQPVTVSPLTAGALRAP